MSVLNYNVRTCDNDAYFGFGELELLVPSETTAKNIK